MAQPTPTLRRWLAPRSFADYVQEAARQLKASGWRVTQQQPSPAVPWHLAASKGLKWCVVQVLLPGTDANVLHDERQRLGAAARVPAKFGTMEQWLAHVRPGGVVAFGVHTLSGYAWGSAATSGRELAARFGAAPPAGQALTAS